MQVKQTTSSDYKRAFFDIQATINGLLIKSETFYPLVPGMDKDCVIYHIT